MNWVWLVSYFFGGVFTANAIPHFVAGTMVGASIRQVPWRQHAVAPVTVYRGHCGPGTPLEKERCIMNWLWLVSYFFGGAFAANAIPHFVSGTMGQSFQSPFAKPPGKGLSSSTVNVVWGFFNAVLGYLLIAHVGAFNLRATTHIFALGMGALLISIFSARHFGQFHGGNTQSRP
jgi:hypothetical protein